MDSLTKENINKFNEYYHKLHDSYIEEIDYNVSNSKLELTINVAWSGEPILKEENTFETNRTKLKLYFSDIKKFNIKDYFSWDYINEIYIKYVKLENDEYICFASDENDPLIYIVCNHIEYKEI